MELNRNRSPLGQLRAAIRELTTQVQASGKLAFDRDDPVAAKHEAERLERIDRAERLLDELTGLLDELGVPIAISNPPSATFAGKSSANVQRLKPNTARKGTKRLPERVLHPPQLMEPVVDVLRELGGEGHLREIWAGIERRLGATFTSSDVERMRSSNVCRWEYNVQWTLTNLKNEGRVEHSGKRGVWRLTARS